MMEIANKHFMHGFVDVYPLSGTRCVCNNAMASKALPDGTSFSLCPSWNLSPPISPCSSGLPQLGPPPGHSLGPEHAFPQPSLWGLRKDLLNE